MLAGIQCTCAFQLEPTAWHACADSIAGCVRVMAAGLPLLQPCHRSLVKLAFTAIGKALEAVGSPWARLRAALHLEVAKAEADSDSFIKVSAF